jgi:hypothetical protein
MMCDKHVVPISEHDEFDIRGAIESMCSKLSVLGIQNIFVDPISVRQPAASRSPSGKRRSARKSS